MIDRLINDLFPDRETMSRLMLLARMGQAAGMDEFLVESGPDIPVGGNPLLQRDIFAAFVGGICTTPDKKTIAWLEAHEALVSEEVHEQFHLAQEEEPDHCSNRGVCMDAENERVGFWSDQEGRKLNLSNREAQLEKGYDVEAALRGEDPMHAVGGGDSLLARAQGAMAASNKAAGAIRTNHPGQFHGQGQSDLPETASEPEAPSEGGE